MFTLDQVLQILFNALSPEKQTDEIYLMLKELVMMRHDLPANPPHPHQYLINRDFPVTAGCAAISSGYSFFATITMLQPGYRDLRQAFTDMAVAYGVLAAIPSVEPGLADLRENIVFPSLNYSADSMFNSFDSIYRNFSPDVIQSLSAAAQHELPHVIEIIVRDFAHEQNLELPPSFLATVQAVVNNLLQLTFLRNNFDFSLDFLPGDIYDDSPDDSSDQ